jgi:hypothetical protein
MNFKNIILLMVCCLALLGSLGGTCWAKWVQDGESLNVEPQKRTMLAGIALAPNALYVAFVEGNTHSAWDENRLDLKIYVKHWDGEKWLQDGENVNETSKSGIYLPSITVIQNKPYVAWHGSDYVGHVRHLENGKWADDGKPIQRVEFPRIINLNNTPYLILNRGSLMSTNRLLNHEWVAEGNPLLTQQIFCYPTWTFSFKGDLYGTWVERSLQKKYQVYVKHIQKGVWGYNAGPVFESAVLPAANPNLIVVNETPYVAADDGKEIYVKHFETDKWVQDGQAMDGGGPVLFYVDGMLHVTWTADKIYFAHFTGKEWRSDGLTLEGYYPAVGYMNGILYVIYQRDDKAGVPHIYVSHWEMVPMPLPTPEPAGTPVIIPDDQRNSGSITNPVRLV